MDREIVRNTWGRWLNASNAQLQHYFILGRELGSETPNQAVLDEQNKYGDLIMEDFVDDYFNITLKSVFMLKFVKDNCPGAKYLLKIDDDTFLNVPQLVKVFSDQSLPEQLITGSLACTPTVNRNFKSKIYMPKYIMEKDKYPNYLHGAGYVISGNLVTPLLDAAMKVPLIPPEDAYLTGLLATKIGINPMNNGMFFRNKRRIRDKCHYQVRNKH